MSHPYCSVCRKSVDVDDLRENWRGRSTCPDCGTELKTNPNPSQGRT